MKKALLAGIVGLVIGAGIAVPTVANADYGYNQTTCQGTSPGGSGVYGPSGDQVACADGFGGETDGTFDGGAVSASAGDGTSNDSRLCAAGSQVTTLDTNGAYVVVDGDDENTANLRGYGALSNNEEGGRENCAQGNNGSGTNSGGSFGVDGGPTAPVPFVGCGFTSGSDYGSTGRDGCYIP